MPSDAAHDLAHDSAVPAQRIFPYLYVDDVAVYLAFLSKAFGFTSRLQHVDPDDPEHIHAETALGDAVVMIGHATAKWGTISPRTLPGLPSALYVLVDDVDEHCQRARAAGATIETEPEDKEWDHRMYTARDCEGNLWYFATPRTS